MKTIDDWARTHAIPPQAMSELRQLLGVLPHAVEIPHGLTAAPGSEARQQSLLILEAARRGIRLFRNNSGAFKDDEGRMVRFGLGNTSKAVNEVLKSSDLIGWESVTITPEMVGTVIARFLAVETKAEEWKFSPSDKHEAAQLNFINLVVAGGGRALFATGPECL